MPFVYPIPSQHFESPSKLILFLFKKAYFEPLVQSTNARIREKVPNPDAHLVTVDELIEYKALDTLATSAFLKPTHMNFKMWFKNVNYLAKPYIGDKNLNLKLSRKRFDFISKYLDVGQKTMVQKKIKRGTRLVTATKANGDPILIYDMNHKLDGFIDGLNKVFLKYKNPNDRILTLDESFRKSYSHKDQLQSFLPTKPDKYGQKFQSLCDSESYVHYFQFDHTCQFSRWQGTNGLLDFMVPEKYKSRGITLCCDNYYFTFDNLKLLHSQGVAAFGTFRKLRIGKVMGQDFVNSLTKKVPKAQFVRKFELFECELDSRIHGDGQFVQFGFYFDKVDKTILFGTNDPRLFNDDEGSHKSKTLNQYEKPNMVKSYNNSKYFVDEFDRMLTQYTSVRPYRNGRCVRRFLGNCWDFCMNNAFILFKNHVQHPSNTESKFKGMLKNRTLRSFFYINGLIGLIGFKNEIPEVQPEVPNCGPFDLSECDFDNPPHAKRTRTRFKCAKCRKYVCKAHSVTVCISCLQNH